MGRVQSGVQYHIFPDYYRFIYVAPSDQLSYLATYACSENDTCSLEFAQKKVPDVSRQSYNTSILMEELTSVLQESRPAGATLSCFDNDTCSNGICQIEYDTVSNSQRVRKCATESTNREPVVAVYDSGRDGSFNVRCNRTRCNSPATFAQVKMILAKYQLTDAYGRIPANETVFKPVTFSSGDGLMASMFLMSGLSFVHGFLF